MVSAKTQMRKNILAEKTTDITTNKFCLGHQVLKLNFRFEESSSDNAIVTTT